MKNNYKLKKDKNNITWVSIDPLITDLQTHKEMMYKIKDSNQYLSQQEKQTLELRILGLESIEEFMQALIKEQIQDEISKPRKQKL